MRNHMILRRMTFAAPDRALLTSDWLFAPGVMDVDAGVKLFQRVNVQDFAACERTQLGMSSRSYRKGGVLVEQQIGGGDASGCWKRWIYC